MLLETIEVIARDFTLMTVFILIRLFALNRRIEDVKSLIRLDGICYQLAGCARLRGIHAEIEALKYVLQNIRNRLQRIAVVAEDSVIVDIPEDFVLQILWQLPFLLCCCYILSKKHISVAKDNLGY